MREISLPELGYKSATDHRQIRRLIMGRKVELESTHARLTIWCSTIKLLTPYVWAVILSSVMSQPLHDPQRRVSEGFALTTYPASLSDFH